MISQGEFYSIGDRQQIVQQADTAYQDDPPGKRTSRAIVSRDFGGARPQNTFNRDWCSMHPKAKEIAQTIRNVTACDGDQCGCHHCTVYRGQRSNSSRVEHEQRHPRNATSCSTAFRRMDEEEGGALVVNGFCKDVLQALPIGGSRMEAQALVAISLEGSVGNPR